MLKIIKLNLNLRKIFQATGKIFLFYILIFYIMGTMLLKKNGENCQKIGELIETVENKVVSNLVVKTGLSVDELINLGVIIDNGKGLTVNDIDF